jgi:hypothetical protein
MNRPPRCSKNWDARAHPAELRQAGTVNRWGATSKQKVGQLLGDEAHFLLAFAGSSSSSEI